MRFVTPPWLLVLALVAAPAMGRAQESSSPSREELQTSLRAACEARFRELKAQGQEHLAATKWDRDATGVRGEYVDYSPDYVCALSETMGTVPVGRMRYQEIHFEKRGEDVAEAMEASPVPVRIEEVTQVWVYRRGLWE